MTSTNHYFSVHFETLIDNTFIKYISNLDEADEFIQTHKHDKIILFYQNGDISIDEALDIQTNSVQIYPIISNFSPENLKPISEYLYELNTLLNAVASFDAIHKHSKELGDFNEKRDETMINILMNVANEYERKNQYVDNSIFSRCRNILNQYSKSSKIINPHT